MSHSQMEGGAPEECLHFSITVVLLSGGSWGRQEAISTVNHLCFNAEALIDCLACSAAGEMNWSLHRNHPLKQTHTHWPHRDSNYMSNTYINNLQFIRLCGLCIYNPHSLISIDVVHMESRVYLDHVRICKHECQAMFVSSIYSVQIVTYT